MCGISGVYHFDGQPVSETVLKRMTDVISHRGPDGDGYYVDDNLGFGHRRLAIIDLSPLGKQPMGNETGDVIITFNGEIFNFHDLRIRLQALGHQFRSQADTEVIIHAYEEWGTAAVGMLNGQFAFALWDRNKRQLLLARDRFGVKPLYYYRDHEKLIFASEIKAILEYPGIQRKVHYGALNEYFTFQNILTDNTLFDGIKLLPAGCFMSIDAASGTSAEPQRYWDFCLSTEPFDMSEDEAAEELFRLFKLAVTRQLMSDVPLASYLSGGMDSGSITAIARQHLGRIQSFTCGFDLTSASGLELGFDERARAEVMANRFKTEHYEVVLHAGDMEQVMPELIWHLEDLRVGQCYPNYYIARLAGKFVKVVLSGAGGDELFGGYPWRYYRGMNSGSESDYYQNYYNFWQRLVADEDKAQLFTPSTYSHLKDNSTFDVFRSIFEPASMSFKTNEDFVNASLYFELKTFLHGLLLVEDKVSMAHSLEARVPFLDNDLVDFAMRVPARYKLRNLGAIDQAMDEDDVVKRRRYEAQSGDGKMILRKAMQRHMPPEIAAGVKQGFSAPDASWFRGESIDYINNLLRNPRARIYEYLHPTYVTGKLDEHTNGQKNNRLFIWSLLSFEWWLRKYL
jgi:asparagine synthase (glutamine-hydrolysing)